MNIYSPVKPRICRPRSAAILLSATVLLSISAAFPATTLYLGSDGVPLASMDGVRPDGGALANHDPGRDDHPGLLLLRGGSGWNESDPALYQQWVGPADGVLLSGRVGIEFWSALRDFARDRRGVVEAFLLDCDPIGADCSLIARGRKDIFDWSGGFASWTRNAVEFGEIDYVVAAGRSLSVKLIVPPDAEDDMWFAYDSTSHPSRLSDRVASDTVVDGDFDDWFNAGGTEFVVDDQGGPEDFGSPGKLDITRFAVSSNLVDTFFLLMVFDDVPPQSTTAATLIDTDFDNDVNYALVATMEDADTTVELYSCDDTITLGCHGAFLEKVYPSTFYRMSPATGPWGDDAHLEIALPFHELGQPSRVVVFTSLVSYAAANLLTSPKDSVLGDGVQDYENGIQYDRVTGVGRLVGAIGEGFHVIRHTDPSLVRSAAGYAFTYTAPFDDAPGSLDDGQNYFYVVEKEGGLSLGLSAHAHRVDGTVRLGFDDHQPDSAPVDGFLSDISQDPDSVEADGTSAVTVTVVPRDGTGTPVGSGCAVSVDPILLSPGELAGPVTDRYDGSYTFRVVSMSPGSGTVEVTVEGIALQEPLQVTFH